MCPMIFPHMFPIFSQKNLGFSSQLCEITRPRVSRDVVFRRPGAECEGPTSQRPATVKGRVFFWRLNNQQKWRFHQQKYGDVNNQWIWVKSSTKDGGHNRMHMFASSSRHCYLPSISTCTTRLAVVDRSVRTKMKGTILCNICIMCMYIYILHTYCTYISTYTYMDYIFTCVQRLIFCVRVLLFPPETSDLERFDNQRPLQSHPGPILTIMMIIVIIIQYITYIYAYVYIIYILYFS